MKNSYKIVFLDFSDTNYFLINSFMYEKTEFEKKIEKIYLSIYYRNI